MGFIMWLFLTVCLVVSGSSPGISGVSVNDVDDDTLKVMVTYATE